MTVTPTTWNWPRFSEPVKPRYLRQDHSNVDFRILVPTAATPTALVFSKWSEPRFKQVRIDPDVNNEPQRPTAPTTGPLVFSTFGLPAKSVQRNSDVNSSFFIQPVTTPVTPVFSQNDYRPKSSYQEGWITQTETIQPIYPVFTDFDYKKTPSPQEGYVTQTAIQTPQIISVFSSFSTPNKPKAPIADSLFISPLVITPLQVPYTGVISSDYVFKRTLQTDGVVNTTYIPPVVVTTVLPLFSLFSQPAGVRSLNTDLSFRSFLQTSVPTPVQPTSGKWPTRRITRKMADVDSSTIGRVVYTDDGKLEVYFKTGRVYTYDNINEKTVHKLVKAKSSGKFFHKHVKDKYQTARIK